ncbi:hypothetical protein HYT17_01850 [Candidatus Microgenomates bacterium]|nr:hypothetical protein [Candidatus Microgenomates bacterium]
MKISLIGMSNSGKTHWSTKLSRELERAGFVRFAADELIEKKLETVLKKLGFAGIHDMARWMGQPYEKRYQTNSQKYLALEKEAMEEILSSLQKLTKSKNIVIDTTGSVIYLGDKLMSRLKKLTAIVYLDTPESVQKQMYENYIKNPKPVIWGDSFRKLNGESDFAALSRCYPKLLAFRTKRYKKYANIVLDYFMLREKNFSAEQFVKHLPKIAT